ncbi:hypothetical protein SeLEV6574_g04685 [Synchytrium endobioticum]|uniref:Uncharacterized protein n=1 Tax=Synchytrium endobioticum TaxID=286115 RepID=A0A507CYD0_9FUNG|nr:hypothetical protein SeLEV6574_g04685 [Synchytrium endobioticum]
MAERRSTHQYRSSLQFQPDTPNFLRKLQESDAKRDEIRSKLAELIERPHHEDETPVVAHVDNGISDVEVQHLLSARPHDHTHSTGPQVGQCSSVDGSASSDVSSFGDKKRKIAGIGFSHSPAADTARQQEVPTSSLSSRSKETDRKDDSQQQAKKRRVNTAKALSCFSKTLPDPTSIKRSPYAAGMPALRLSVSRAKVTERLRRERMLYVPVLRAKHLHLKNVLPWSGGLFIRRILHKSFLVAAILVSQPVFGLFWPPMLIKTPPLIPRADKKC